jgi:hypothetical protein
MNAMMRNQARFFSIDMESADANLLTKILKDHALQLLAEGRPAVQQRLADYGHQISRYALDGAEMFLEEDFSEICLAMARARHWQVSHRPKSWDRHGHVIITLGFPDGDSTSWPSREWRIAPDSPRIAALRRSLRQIVPDRCTEAELI